MKYKIIVDSCGELPEFLYQSKHFESVPLEIFVDEDHFIDDESFNQAEFLRISSASPNCPKSTCPSPERYLNAFTSEAERIYAVTLSSRLSGSYNSAQLGKTLLLEESKNKKIHIFDSKSASVGETLIALRIRELEEQGLDFEEVVERTEQYIDEMNTFFVLETLDTLRKNGRLSNLKAFVASALNIKPVMGATAKGEICQLDQARGMNKALDKMVQAMIAVTKNCESKILAISHCNCPDRARMVKEKIEKLVKFKDIFVIDTAGISTMYANNGGVIMAV